MPYKTTVDRNLCTSVGTCVAIAPNTYALDADSLVTIKEQNGDPDNIILEAAKSCPVSAITVLDDEGKKIWSLA